MSTFKKVISIVLCLTMVFGTFAVAGDLFVPKASATVGESRIPTFAKLKETYGDDFVYYGIDVMEYDADNNPYYTDHYVQPGDKLQIQHTVKMTRYMGVGTSYLMFDAAFFDLTNGTGTMPSSLDATMNPNHTANKTDKTITGARGL
ncbi:MAG: hypothetical protein IJB45_05890, partial [Clostridia bacterium]|nr:hypothetical protein [Clostridia bacterium]